MAKRNQYNKTSLTQVSELTLNKIVTNGVAQFKSDVYVTGTLYVEHPTDPEIRLTKTNPGATTRSRILEETIDFTTIPAGTTFTSSLAIPLYSRVDAVGVYVSSSFSGSSYLLKLGLAGSGIGYNYNDVDYFYNEPGTAPAQKLEDAGDSAVFFPTTSGSWGPGGGRSALNMGITGSNVKFQFETSATTNLTGSIVFSAHTYQYGPPTS